MAARRQIITRPEIVRFDSEYNVKKITLEGLVLNCNFLAGFDPLNVHVEVMSGFQEGSFSPY